MPIIITAVTNILLHLSHALQGSRVVMRTHFTESLVIALGCKHFKDGVQGKNNLLFINVNSFYPEFVENLCQKLPAYDALTGCDYTDIVFKNSNVRPLKLFQKDTEAQIVLSELSTLAKIDENTISTTESFMDKLKVSIKMKMKLNIPAVFYTYKLDNREKKYKTLFQKC